VTLHQQKFLMVSVVFSDSPWLPRYLKNVQNETTQRFSAGNTKCFLDAEVFFYSKPK